MTAALPRSGQPTPRRPLSDLIYWPRQIAAGFLQLWQYNGPAVAVQLTACNLLRIRRIFRVQLHGFSIALRSGTPDLAVAIDSLGSEFEPLAGTADTGGLIIDAGGYIGTAALKFARLFPQATIVTIEPSAANLATLRRNVEGVANIVVVEAALAASEGLVMLHDGGTGEWGYSVLDRTGQGLSLGTVRTVTIAGLLTQYGRDEVQLLKLDVEGAEVGILRESAEWMGRTEIVIAELHEHFAPGAEAAFAGATAGRDNRQLPGEKVISVRRG